MVIDMANGKQYVQPREVSDHYAIVVNVWSKTRGLGPSGLLMLGRWSPNLRI